MGPQLGRIAFNLGMLVLVMAIIPLPFLSPGSAEFVAALIAFAVAVMFLGVVVWRVRREVHSFKARTDQTGQRDNRGGNDAGEGKYR